MSDLIGISPSWLEANAHGVREDIHCYWRGFFLARYWMWRRLDSLARTIALGDLRSSALDVGGGAGLLLPTLSRHFESVTLLDLDPSVAEKVKNYYALTNVKILRANVLETELPANSFDLIVASAFLEHFPDASLPIGRVHQWLKPGGIFLVDLPTENWAYRLGRAVGRIEKPKDHYHGAKDIRPLLLNRFTPVREGYIPFRPFALYYQASLKKRA